MGWNVLLVMLLCSIAGLLSCQGPGGSSREPEEREGRKQDILPDENPVTLTVIYENHPGREGLEEAWGFSCLIRGLKKTILFMKEQNNGK